MCAETNCILTLCGPIAENGKPAAGGYESSNARVLGVLTRSGWQTVALPYPSVKDSSLRWKVFSYLRAFFSIWQSIRSLPAGTIVHFTPMVRHFIFPEWILAQTSVRRGIRVVMDLRGGNKKSEFDRRSKIYQFFFTSLIRAADVVSVEGENYIPFVKCLNPNVPVFYLPNFLPTSDIPEMWTKGSTAPVRFVYVGAVSEAKGVLHATRLIAALQAEGTEVQFDVFGRVETTFADQLKAEANGAEWLTLHGAQPYSVIQAALSQAHFFLFLTKWHGEGHSNALTEAMSQGVIPIVTDHGFNRNVVGEDGIVVKDRGQLTEAVTEIKALLKQPDMLAERGERIVVRVRENYSEESVAKTLEQLYLRALGA